MKRTYIQLTCDKCGCADYYSPGKVETAARKNGWIITKDGKHYDNKECYKSARVRIEEVGK